MEEEKKEKRQWIKYRISLAATTDLVTFSNPCNHSGVSQEEERIPARCQHNESSRTAGVNLLK